MKMQIELSTGKKIIIDEINIAKSRKVGEKAAARAQGDQLRFNLYMQEELFKVCLSKIDGTSVTDLQKENLDEILEFSEYREVILAMEEIIGRTKSPKISMVNDSGDK